MLPVMIENLQCVFRQMQFPGPDAVIAVRGENCTDHGVMRRNAPTLTVECCLRHVTAVPPNASSWPRTHLVPPDHLIGYTNRCLANVIGVIVRRSSDIRIGLLIWNRQHHAAPHGRQQPSMPWQCRRELHHSRTLMFRLSCRTVIARFTSLVAFIIARASLDTTGNSVIYAPSSLLCGAQPARLFERGSRLWRTLFTV